MARLRTVSPKDPGWTRRRAGKGFIYLDDEGRRLAPDDIERCKRLVIPPAWEEVWICPVPNGHLQAVGTDDAGRRQYLYHEQWRIKRDKSKHDRVLTSPPGCRGSAEGHEAPRAGRDAVRTGARHRFPAARPGLFPDRRRGVRGDEQQLRLATIQKQHVTVYGGEVIFDYVAKSGQDGTSPSPTTWSAPRSVTCSAAGRRTGAAGVQGRRRWSDVTSADINAYVKEIVGGEVSAKDFRTWHGTVIAAVALAQANESARHPDGPAPCRRRGHEGRVRLPRQHSGRGPEVLRRSAAGRPLRRRRDDLARGSPATDTDLSDGVTHGKIERAVLNLLAAPQHDSS